MWLVEVESWTQEEENPFCRAGHKKKKTPSAELDTRRRKPLLPFTDM
jgi:hypothetical protein